MKKIIVIGGGAAGCKAASKAKRENKENQIELYTEENNIAYSRCGLPYYIEGNVKNIEDLIIKTKEDFEKMGISVFQNQKVEKIIPEKNCIIVNNKKILYDKLIIATGSKVNLPKIKNINANNIFTLHTLESAIKIKEKIKTSKNAIIVGCGYIGIELIEALTYNNLNVIILEKANRIANDFDEEFSDEIKKIIHRTCENKIKIFLNEEIEEINVDKNNNFKSIITKNKKELFSDILIFATGITPNSELTINSGINIGIKNSIDVNHRMKTNIENIYACGDCAQKYCITTKEPTYIGLGTIANKEARVVGINVNLEDNFETFDGVLKSIIAKFYNYSIAKTGMTFKEALEYSKKIKLEPISEIIIKNDKAGYMPNVNKIMLKIVADKRSGEILGAQCIGLKGKVAQRINTITTALKSRTTVDELLNLDLAYAPPFSSSIDPILTALYKLKEKIKK